MARPSFLSGLTAALIVCATAAWPQAIQQVPYETLEQELGALIDFENYPKRASPGRALEGTQVFEGARIAERFRGQLVAQEAGFDALLLAPQSPLTLEPGAPGQNLAVEFIFFMSNQLMGIAPPGFPKRNGGGEGAVSILFDRDQSALGFRVTAEPEPKTPAPKGWIEVAFYRRDGTLIDTAEVELEWMLAGYGFRRSDGAEDIAGISITNRDPQGVMIDDVIFDRDRVVGWLISEP
ncbi:hypothetical protein AIOL_000768 [Candidatus Rhodobacter oscarellae]|uniref:Uncharacterized protein n=2 Tax=Candidatus Rhodobacter oscarellae TaxID=1675527 RepID=A0A0J9EFY4_9RHOB|nr:hypothetical protein AIOL_000768 [Candidatus Rhodobacter lobularis]